MNNVSTRAALVSATALPCAALMAGCGAMSFVPASYGDSMESNLRLLVVAELREAQKLGLVTVGEETPPSINEGQLRMIGLAVEEATVGEVIEAR